MCGQDLPNISIQYDLQAYHLNGGIRNGYLSDVVILMLFEQVKKELTFNELQGKSGVYDALGK